MQPRNTLYMCILTKKITIFTAVCISPCNSQKLWLHLIWVWLEVAEDHQGLGNKQA